MSYNDLFSKGSLAKKAAFKVAEHLQHRNHKIMKHKVHACKSGAVTKKKKGGVIASRASAMILPPSVCDARFCSVC